jgi:large subunit ribosomal protein L1
MNHHPTAKNKVENKAYPLAEALALLSSLPKAKFDESVELHVRLGIDPAKSDQTVRTVLTLPHAAGKAKKIAVFTTASHEAEAKEAGADLVGGKDLITEIIKTKQCNFDIAVATPDIMKELAPAARILGPKGLMPTPKNETITTNLSKTLGELKRGKTTLKNDDGGNVHVTIGKRSWDTAKLSENLSALLLTIQKARPTSAKGVFIKSATLCSTMGPAIRIAV